MARYRLRVDLVGSTPAVWREFSITGRTRLRMLHLALQTMMGWRDQHLYAFTDVDPFDVPPGAGRRWEPLDFSEADEAIDDDTVSVEDVLETTDALWYEYDFGDGWVHRIDTVERLPDDPQLARVVLLDGDQPGAFEDAGGVHGYTEKLAIAADPSHPDHQFIQEWMSVTVGPWAARSFDVVAVQTELNLLFDPETAGASRHDMSGLVRHEHLRAPGELTEASPISVLAAELPPQIRAELRQHLHRRGILAPSEIDADTARRMVRPFSWLIDAVGTDGIALTPAGWLPPAVVLAGMTELGWIDEWIGKGNREDLTPPIANLREIATRMGLVRVQKGRLILSAAAKRALNEPVRQLRLVVGGLYRRLSDAETDAAALLLLSIADGTARAERWRTVSFGLEMCGWRSSTGRQFTARDIGDAVSRTQAVLDLIGEGAWHRGNHEEDPLLAVFAREALR